MNLIRTLARHMLPGVLGTVLVLAASSSIAQTVTYFHNDPAGTPVLATDASGNVVWKENHRPYGQKLNNPAAAADNSVGFAGKPFDADTGLSYLGARYYDPLIGRFMGVDPQAVNPADGHSINRYAYANNNPYKYVDPDGRAAQFIVRMEWTAVTWVANRFGAARLGSTLGLRLYDLTHADENLAPPPAAKPKEGAESQEGEAHPRAGLKFTPKGKREVKDTNAAENDGVMTCEGCGSAVVNPKQHQKGVTPPSNEAHVDHVDARSKGGAGSPSNGQILCRTCNLAKSDN
jgi:RHS repeat-associated protein